MRSRCQLSAHVILIATLLYSTAFATITGTVTDKVGRPVSGALVTFTDEANLDNIYNDYTDDEGKYELPISSSSVDEVTPSGFQLYQNYPNPFNPSTTIPFSLNEAGFVNILIYNITGQKVRTLVDNHHTGGSHTVTWDGLDDRLCRRINIRRDHRERRV